MAWLGTRRSIRLDGELTSVKISQDSQYALINRASENGPPAVRVLFVCVRVHVGATMFRHACARRTRA